MEDEKQRSLLTQRVETMVSVIELLLETLKDLSDEEFEEFKKVLNQLPFLRPDLFMFETTDMQSLLLKIIDLQDTVFSMVQTFGQMSVEKTKEILKKMKRNDLVQRLSDSSSGAKMDEHLSALIHKVATMAAFKELLLETFYYLSYNDLNTYKWLLQFTLFERNLPELSWEQLWADSVDQLVDVMVEKYGQQSVEVTKEVFMDINRMDLVQRLSETSSGHKEKHSVDEHWPALTQKVETMASVIELLLETLKDLSYGEVNKFKKVLRQIHFPSFRLGKWSLLESTDTSLRLLETMGLQNTVFLLVQTFGQRSVETTKKVLKKMKWTDLDQRLSDSSSGSKKKPSTDEQRSALIQKVATIAAVKQLLLETLDDLSNKELQELKRLLKIIFSQKDLQMVLRHTADRAEIVDLMVETYGQQSVELTREVFMDLNRTDLVQRLSKPSSGLKEKPSVDDHQTALLERVSARAAVRKLLFETLNGLSFKELEKFKFLLKFTYFQKSLPQISEGQMESTHSAEELVDLMVENLLKIQQSVEVTKEVFMDMNRTDLVQRLSETSSGLKEKQQLSLIQRVETMASVIELLLETLKDLSYEEFEEFKKVLSQFKFFRHSFLKFETTGIQLRLLEITDKQDTVFSMVQTFGQKSVQTAKDVLMLMKKTDLVQRFSDQNPGPKKKHSVDEHLSALIHKVATMASVKELLSETLNDLSSEEFKTFKWLLQFTLFKRNLPHILLKQLKCADWAKLLVDVMVEKYGQQSVEVMKEVFMDMNRMDLVQRLSETSSGLKAAGSSTEAFDVYTTEREKHSVDEHWPALTKKVETMVSVIELLLETLKDLTYGKFKEFKEILRQIPFPSFRLGKWRLLETMGLQDTVFFLVQTFGQRSLETIKEILKKMKRTDLDQRLSDSSSGSKKKPSTDEQRSALIQKVATIAAVKQLLLETLNDLSNKELKKFKVFLQLIFSQKDLQMDLRDTAGRAEIVDLMVETYGQQSVEFTREVFMDLHRTDLVQRLSKPSSELKEKPSVDKCRSALQERVSAREAVRKIIFQTLNGLSFEELEKFKFLLQFTNFQKNLPQISKRQMPFAHSAEELVDLMVENLVEIQQPVEVIKEVFMDMNRTDLVQRLSETSSGLKDTQTTTKKKPGSSQRLLSLLDVSSEGPSRSLVLKGCGSSMQDSSDWTKLEPDVNSTDADEAPAYSVQTEAGKFECSVSGLRWFCKEKVSFKYQFCSWEEPMERMESIQYMPAGPLIDITVIAGRLDEVYLPHWICIDDNPAILDKFAILHINDCGDVVEKVSEVTQSHVKLSEPVFSPRAVLMKIGFTLKISCNVLIYHKPNTPFLKLHVYLIPHDLALKKRVDEKESSKGYQLIVKPRPDKYLKMKQGFKLAADIDTARICPKEITLRYDSQEPNFYEVVSENPDGDFHLILSHTNKSDPVWTCEIQKDDDLRYQNSPHLQVQETGGQSSLPGSSDKKHTVNEHLSALMQNATITTDRERLWYVLGRLKQEEFKEFKWFLQDRDILAGLPCIQSFRLEKGELLDLVDLIWQTYSEHSVEVTKKVFKKINRNDLVQMLSGSKASGSSA